MDEPVKELCRLCRPVAKTLKLLLMDTERDEEAAKQHFPGWDHVAQSGVQPDAKIN